MALRKVGFSRIVSPRALISGLPGLISFTQDGNEAPAHQCEAALTLLDADDGDGLTRRHVGARRKFRLIEVLEQRAGFLRALSEAIKSAHGERD